MLQPLSVAVRFQERHSGEGERRVLHPHCLQSETMELVGGTARDAIRLVGKHSMLMLLCILR